MNRVITFCQEEIYYNTITGKLARKLCLDFRNTTRFCWKILKYLVNLPGGSRMIQLLFSQHPRQSRPAQLL